MPSQERTFDAVIDAYLLSPKFAELKPATKVGYHRELALVGTAMGKVPVEQIRPALVQQFMDKISHYSGKQHVSISAIKAVERWAIVRDLIQRPITLGVEITESSGGHVPWTDEQVALAERSARRDIARAVTLAANTGQRGSDTVRMGWTDIETIQGRAGINVKQQKTGRQVWCPINEALARAMETWKRRPGPFLLHVDGTPWTRQRLSEAWKHERQSNPALRPLLEAHLVLHGLRGHACVRLYRAGLNTREVSVLVGMSLPMVENYCRLSVQKDNAIAAVIRLEEHEEKRKEKQGTHVSARSMNKL